MSKTTHPHVEFQVTSGTGVTHTFRNRDKAFEAAATLAVFTGKSTYDALIYSKSGAYWYGGDEAVEQYQEDPDASVFHRIELKANVVGRVP